MTPQFASRRKAGVNIWRGVLGGGRETSVAPRGRSGGSRLHTGCPFIATKANEFTCLCLNRAARQLTQTIAEANSHLYLCAVCSKYIQTTEMLLECKIHIRQVGQEIGSTNGYERCKYESECVSCLLANKHIIFKSAQWCQVAWDDPPSTSPGITVS